MDAQLKMAWRIGGLGYVPGSGKQAAATAIIVAMVSACSIPDTGDAQLRSMPAPALFYRGSRLCNRVVRGIDLIG